ncbi:hypothetical protein F2Q69_00037964 [Brassica cretica]|uniref:F-box associated beta-propeller type 1 domain-containing protein n=1 Tax=Brassica cretica TaxID=69181 RepID=A0A8S9SNY1_BRACR|nr:hypothetical protein F2Q69_00037964 [Brassica cretica]
MNDEYDDTAVLSVVRDEQLSVLHQYLHLDLFEMKIWVSNMIGTKKVSWGEFLVVDVVLLNVVSFVVDEEHKVAVCCSTGKDDPSDDSEEECTSVSIIGKNIQSLVYDEGAIYRWIMATSHELRSKPGSNFKEENAQKQKETIYKEASTGGGHFFKKR